MRRELSDCGSKYALIEFHANMKQLRFMQMQNVSKFRQVGGGRGGGGLIILRSRPHSDEPGFARI